MARAGLAPWRWLLRQPMLLAVGLAQLFGALEFLEQDLLELRFALLPRQVSRDLLLVEIDGASLAELDQWPLPRSLYGELLDRLMEAGAARVAFDIDFSNRSQEAEDRRFAAALKRAGNRVVLPAFVTSERDETGAERIGLRRPLLELEADVIVAHVNFEHDADGYVRRFSPNLPGNAGALPALPLVLAETGAWTPSEAYLDFGIQPASLLRVSFVDVLRGRVPTDLLKDKRLIVGATAAELGDLVAVPHWGVVPGAVLVALAAETMHQGRPILRPSGIFAFLVAVAIATLLGPHLARGGWRRSTGNAAAALIAASAICLAAQKYFAVSLDSAPALVTVLGYYVLGLVQLLDRQTGRLLEQTLVGMRLKLLFQRIVEMSPDALLLTAEDGTIELANPAAERLFGREKKALSGSRMGELLPPESWPRGEPPALDWFLALPQSLGEAEVGRADGTRRTVEILASTLHTPGSARPQEGAADRVLLVLRDISDRKRQEAEQRSALERLQAAEREANERALAAAMAKANFLHSASHELRTPLNHIEGFGQLLLSGAFGALDPKQREYVEHICHSAEQLTRLITEVLTISDVSEDHATLSESWFSVADLLAAGVATLREAAERGRVTLPELGPSLAQFELFADAEKLARLLRHLLGNAVKFTPPGGKVEVVFSSGPGEFFSLTIANSGPGLTSGEVERALEPFGKLASASDGRFSGLGIGLSIARLFAGLHGGSFDLQSDPRMGTRACVRLPAARVRFSQRQSGPIAGTVDERVAAVA